MKKTAQKRLLLAKETVLNLNVKPGRVAGGGLSEEACTLETCWCYSGDLLCLPPQTRDC
jgi:hypothetical protein